MNNIVSLKWLLARLYESDIVIVDCRFLMGKPDAGRELYEASHIPGAVYLDLEKDLSAPLDEDGHGGRHPLPDIFDLTVALSRVGISNESRVVVYDDQGGAMASRLWWLLKYLGSQPLNTIKPVDILSVCRRLEARGKRETAHRRALAGRILRYAVATGRLERDPTS